MIRLKNILIIGGIVIIPILIFILDLKLHCIFKYYLDIRCPGCGLTRSLYALLNGNILESLYYNILTIPLVIISISLVVLLIYDTINNHNNCLNMLNNFFTKHYKLILFILLTVMIINNIHQI